MADRDAKKLERQLDRISAGLPSGVGGFLRWLRSPSSRWVRIPAGLLLIMDTRLYRRPPRVVDEQ